MRGFMVRFGLRDRFLEILHQRFKILRDRIEFL